jgi:DNA polymerase elongation subunit (family B)
MIMTDTKFKCFIVDIETTVNPDLVELYNENIKAPKNIKDPDKIKANLEEQKKGSVKGMQIDIDYAKVCVIGVKEVGGEIRHLTLKEFDDFIGQVEKENSKIITYNGKNFDFPVLIRSLIREGLISHIRFLKGLCKRYEVYNHIDLIEELNVYGKYKSLDELCRIYLGAGKEEFDHENSTVAEKTKHNEECLAVTEKLYLLFKPLLN